MFEKKRSDYTSIEFVLFQVFFHNKDKCTCRGFSFKRVTLRLIRTNKVAVYLILEVDHKYIFFMKIYSWYLVYVNERLELPAGLTTRWDRSLKDKRPQKGTRNRKKISLPWRRGRFNGWKMKM